MQLLQLFVIPLLTATFFCGCQRTQPGEESEQGKYVIVTTTGMVTDLAKAVAGEHANVKSLMGPGIDPHLYQPSRGDALALQQADVVFYSGLNLEGQMSQILDSIADGDKPIQAVTAGISHDKLFSDDASGSHAMQDPHVWMDVSMWRDCLSTVEDTLVKYDPDHAEDYQANAAAYRSQLDQLHQYVTDVIASIPADQRYLVTAHDAFEYFGRAYNIEVRAVQGITTESEAGIADINELVDFIVKQKIPTVFVESTISARNVEALIEGAGSRGVKVSLGPELYSDAMGKEGTYEGTYIGMIDHNATGIARALGGEAPKGGMSGKLSGK
ncbi:metal ABC transporter solute-binding protein, Zn/Mn family [Calycomorphotria hydatis]|uniref:Periplasmic zinc-binding protein TroA n=1 Tax=Calycomorphotria hydatis TaxID=2528027 RepID=A0A517T535_9PLAN|nr:zinc ABC transporter substrate-binding protein [Calycomorphotria hydatis]QDT63479.1 Periplasmic zinc-binding protein TroA precursor [Calycomorphotria hydatis]